MNPAELNLNPLSQIDPVVIVAVALIVIVTYLLLRRLYVLPYLEVMESREELFSSARRLSAEAAEVTRESELRAEAVLCEAATTAETSGVPLKHARTPIARIALPRRRSLPRSLSNRADPSCGQSVSANWLQCRPRPSSASPLRASSCWAALTLKRSRARWSD